MPVTEIPAELKPISGKDFDVRHPDLGNITLTVFQGRINFKSGIELLDKRYYYAPFITLQRVTLSDDIQVFVLPGDGNKKQIVIPIQWDRQDLPRIVREFLVTQAGESANIREAQVQSVGLKKLKFETAGNFTPKIEFDELNNPDRSTPVFPLRAIVDSQKIADDFVNELKQDLVSIQATYIFEGASFQENTIKITFQEISSTQAFKNLTGPAVKIVTREQLSSVSREVLNTIRVARQIEFDNDDINKLSDTLLTFLLANKKDIQDGFNSLAQEFQNLGFNVNDIKADLITKSQSKQNDLLHTTFSEALRKVQKDDDTSFNLFTNFDDVLDIDFSDKDKYSEYVRNVYAEVLKEKNVETGFEGEKFVPKSINIIRNDFSQLQAAAEVVLESARFVGGDQLRNLFFSKSTISTKQAQPSLEERLSAIATGMAPIGSIFAFPGSKKFIPDGWLECNGDEISKSQHPILDSIIRNDFGTPINPDNIKLPDIQGRIPIAAGRGTGLTERSLAVKSGAETIIIIGNMLPSHSHAVANHHHTWLFQGGGANFNTGNGFNTAVRRTDGSFPGAELGGAQPGSGCITSDEGSSTGVPNYGASGDPVSIIPPVIVLTYIIRVR